MGVKRSAGRAQQGLYGELRAQGENHPHYRLCMDFEVVKLHKLKQ